MQSTRGPKYPIEGEKSGGLSHQSGVKWFKVLGFGGVSIALYTLLYHFSGELVYIEQAIQEGHKSSMFMLPIGIALLFSWVHGAFTGYFWELVGIKAKQ